MVTHECKQEEVLGTIKEFMENTKGFKVVLISMALAIVVQIGSFLFLWGGLTTTVNKNTDYLWNDLSPKVVENTRNIDKILSKFELIQVIRGAQGDAGKQGVQGIQGKPG